MCSTSLHLHDLIFEDTSESLCSRAWRLREKDPFWACWVRMFGRRHCLESFRYYHPIDQ